MLYSKLMTYRITCGELFAASASQASVEKISPTYGDDSVEADMGNQSGGNGIR